jgi:hypothetical protein
LIERGENFSPRFFCDLFGLQHEDGDVESPLQEAGESAVFMRVLEASRHFLPQSVS